MGGFEGKWEEGREKGGFVSRLEYVMGTLAY
jgi:hypothetical protein